MGFWERSAKWSSANEFDSKARGQGQYGKIKSKTGKFPTVVTIWRECVIPV